MCLSLQLNEYKKNLKTLKKGNITNNNKYVFYGKNNEIQLNINIIDCLGIKIQNLTWFSCCAPLNNRLRDIALSMEIEIVAEAPCISSHVRYHFCICYQ